MYLTNDGSIISDDVAGKYITDTDTWPVSWTTVTYGDGEDLDFWNISLSPSDLPNLGFKLAARGCSGSPPAGWGAGAKCFPNDDFLIAIKITYN